ncbi:histone deacetylase 15-like [Aristolochia californica]|uniref:histone deacetylase 15-like n=1 Tax=Aristolochia californica TaxID=171875 RepID=UPI0035DE01E8
MDTESVHNRKDRLRGGEFSAEMNLHLQNSGVHTTNGLNGTINHSASESSINGHITETSDNIVGQWKDLNGNLSDKHVNEDKTLQDFYVQREYLEDDDDDDDSDWEPSQENIVTNKWFCTNCTMANFEDVLHCNACGEYKESEILKYGFFASHFASGVHYHVKSEELERFQVRLDSCKPEATLGNCTAVGFDERMLLHSEVEMKSHPHPERPDRLRAILASLTTAGIFPAKCIPILAREIDQEELQRVHSLEHIAAVESTSSMLSSYFTPDTYANEHSAQAARLAAGICADMALAIMSGVTKNGFALVRPPGHHAGIKQAMGFCLHNNAAIATLAAQAASAKKVLIVDWDVHHGNGTQEIFEKSKSVLYISLHRHEGGWFYPGTGAVDEIGVSDGEGYCVNIPWRCGGVGDGDYIFAFQHIVLPIAKEFSPDLTIVSAGFDAARGDPLGGCDVTPAGYAEMTHMLSSLSNGKLLVILEGGYNLRSISSSATAVIRVLLGENPTREADHLVPSEAGLQTVLEVLKIQLRHWPILKTIYATLMSQWKSLSSQTKKKRVKRKQIFLPVWWQWGRKRIMYRLLRGTRQFKPK